MGGRRESDVEKRIGNESYWKGTRKAKVIKFLYNAASKPQGYSKRFTLYP